MQISVIGTGYVGLVTGTCLADTGNRVTCVDINEKIIEKLNAGQVTIFEPGLEDILERNQKHGRLYFTSKLEDAIDGAEIIFLALPTPPGEDGEADLSYVKEVSKNLAKLIKSYTIIVNKSTVPVGTAKIVRDILANKISTDIFDVVSNPEFLREGAAVSDFMKPDRIVIGSSSDRAIKKMRKLYQPFVRQGNPIMVMDEPSAEMTKYAANSYLATRISFMNEIANICENLGANVDQVRKGMGSDSRIGKRFLFPGIGYGGSCFPKDVQALAKMASNSGYRFDILETIMEVNSRQRLLFVEKIKTHFNGNVKGKKIAIWGLSFKPNTDDIRKAPSLDICNALIDEGAQLHAYDPEAMNNVKHYFGNKMKYAEDLYDAIDHADALAILTEWTVFRTPDFDRMKRKMEKPVIFDGRNVYYPEDMEANEFTYYSIGRSLVNGKDND